MTGKGFYVDWNRRRRRWLSLRRWRRSHNTNKVVGHGDHKGGNAMDFEVFEVFDVCA
jgi:hypothetical protein